MLKQYRGIVAYYPHTNKPWQTQKAGSGKRRPEPRKPRRTPTNKELHNEPSKN
ncbi:hypothetical protein [Klebsiella phage vB_KpnS-VAC2]|uniref:Uncharacterized protein n=1 Tax=Klebsiella phage vB_KpnS-VAC2 TaxID=2864369 RepID=A0AAE8BY06_9CAUD|nr:hypothetical protein [Klebsiella phage vB_KpnS-VAC2]